MNELSLFAGAGGGILGGVLLGWKTVCAVEIDPYARRVLLARQNDGCLQPFPVHDDVCSFNGAKWRDRIDVISGGFPCQDISVAGKGEGITGQRSGLWKEFARIIGEVRSSYVFVENSPALLVRGIGVVLGDLAAMGYDAQWCVLGGDNVGMCHKRHRLWIFAVNTYKNRRNEGEIFCKKFNQEESCRRQFTRAISSTISESAHPRNVGDSSQLARWVERCSVVGNGQIPSVAALAWQILTTNNHFPAPGVQQTNLP